MYSSYVRAKPEDTYVRTYVLRWRSLLSVHTQGHRTKDVGSRYRTTTVQQCCKKEKNDTFVCQESREDPGVQL